MNNCSSRQARKIGQAGQSLVEVVVALVVVGLIAAGLIKISSTSIKNARYSSEETGAVALGEQKMAELRAYAVNNSVTFWTTSLPYTDSGISTPYCWLIDATLGVLPTETTPRYSESAIAGVNVYIFWEALGTNLLCGNLGTGLVNYGRHLEFNTQITK